MGVCLYCQAPLEEGAIFCPHCFRTQFTFGPGQNAPPLPLSAGPSVNRAPPGGSSATENGAAPATVALLRPLPAMPGAVPGPGAPQTGASLPAAPLPVGSRQCPTCNAVISIRAVVCPVCATPIPLGAVRDAGDGEGSGPR